MAPSDASQWKLAPHVVQVPNLDPDQHPDDPLTIGAHNYDVLHSQVADLPGDQVVSLPARVVRELLRPHKPGREQCIGARIDDPAMRVTYTVTIGQEEGSEGVPPRVWLTSCHVQPHDEDPDPQVFRVPARTLARAAVAAMARWEAPQDGRTVTLYLPAPHDGPLTRPEPEILCELAQSAVPHREIAASYGVRVETVQEWMRLARRNHPELNWPAPRHSGRKGIRTTGQTTTTQQK